MNVLLWINSLGVAAVATFLAMLLAAPVALCLQWFPPAGRRCLLGGVLVVLVLPAFFVAGMWMQIVGFAGAWRVGGEAWGGRLLPVLMSALVLALLLWPVTALLLTGVWDRVELRLLEAQPDLRGWPLWRHGLWPLARGHLLPPAALTAALALGNFGVPSLFQARIWSEEIWVDFSTRFDVGAAFTRSWPLIAISLLLAVLALRRPLEWPVRGIPAGGGLLGERLGRRGRWLAGGGAAVVLGVSLGLPLLLAGGATRTWVELPGALRAAWPALVRSVGYAACAATLVLGVALATARFRAPAALAPAFFLPGIFTGMLLLRAFERPPLLALRDTWVVVVAGLGLRHAFVAWFLAARLWRGADARLHEVARLAGAGTLAQWRHVIWPRSGGALAAGWFFVYVLCLWDVETLILIVPPGGDTLALMIFNLLHYGHNAQVSALCVLLAGAALFPLGLWALGAALYQWMRGGGSPRSGTVLGLALAAGTIAGTGCTPPLPSTQAPIDSRLFASVEVIGRRGTGPGSFQKPRSVAVDGEDNLFVVDMTGRVQKFSPDGHWLLGWQLPDTTIGKAKGMATAPDGGILIVEPHYHRVNRFSPDGRLLAQWGVQGTNAGQLWFPRAVAVAPGGDLFVSEYGRVERVQRFHADGAGFVRSFGSEGTEPGELNRAEGLGVDSEGNLYVADSCNHRVQVFAPDGRRLRGHGAPGQGRGEMSYPYDVRVDSAGYQFVCEFGNSRVQVFDAQDRFVEFLGGPGSAPGRMHNPWSLCLDSRGNLYVADSLNHRVLKFTRRQGMAGSALGGAARGRPAVPAPRSADGTGVRRGGSGATEPSRMRLFHL